MAQAQGIFLGYPESMHTRVIGQALAVLRHTWEDAVPDEDWWARETQPNAILRHAHMLLNRQLQLHLRPVLNLTGTVIHTNLGRAPLSARAVDAVRSVAQGYSNLEYDLEHGDRGSRHAHVEQLVCDLTGAEAALVVNNNAAAAFLVLKEMASGGEAIVSRGQLVEIGGSFRVPDIMRESGVSLVEVGTTNKTRLSDYETAVSAQTRLVVRVHTSNFRIIGFTEQPELADLVETSHRCDIPVYEDLGSGALFDYTRVGVGDEPTIRHSVACGVDVVSFSGDKLLGGAQSGIIVGKQAWIQRMKKNPLTRALRVDKMTLAALEATLVAHTDEDLARTEIPVIRMLTESYASIAARCQSVYAALCGTEPIMANLTLEVADDVSRIGGGALPEVTLPTRVIRLFSNTVSAQTLTDQLRGLPLPVVARIAHDAVVLDVRTLLPGQERDLVGSIESLVRQIPEQGDGVR